MQSEPSEHASAGHAIAPTNVLTDEFVNYKEWKKGLLVPGALAKAKQELAA